MINNKEMNHIDCIKMKNSIQKQIYAEIKNMSGKDLLCYFNGKDNPVRVLKVPRTRQKRVS